MPGGLRRLVLVQPGPDSVQPGQSLADSGRASGEVGEEGPDRGELSASGEVPEPEEVRASAALVGCSRRAGFWCPRRGACPERWRRWSGARVGVPASGAWAGLPCHPTTACPVACLGAHGMGRGRGRAAHHDPTATAQGCRVSVCMVVPVSHGHIAGPDAVPTISRGRAGGGGAPGGGGWVGDGARRGTPGRWGSPPIRVHPMGGVLRALESRSTEGVRSRGWSASEGGRRGRAVRGLPEGEGERGSQEKGE